MIDCPTERDWHEALDSGVVMPNWDAHLESCISCRKTLDRLTEKLPNARKTTAIPHDEPTPLLLDWLRQSPQNEPAGVRPGDTIDQFRLERELGRGGMGSVFLATDERLHRSVAIKILHAHRRDRAGIDRFAREAEAAARLNHPNLVPLLASGVTTDGVPYFVMPNLPGGSLAGKIHTRHRVSSRDAARWIAELAEGLEAVHRAGLLHRDIKPSNVLFDADGTPKLADFGLARFVDRPGTTATIHGVIGTPEYLSPELARDASQASRASDLYALGLTLYECLTRTVPFRGDPLAVLRQIQQDDPPPPRAFASDVPRQMEIIVLKAIAADPTHRYSSAAAFGDDLRRWLAGHPISARPATAWARAGHWVRRHSALAAAGVGAGLLIASLATTIVLQAQARRRETALNADLSESVTREVRARQRFEEAYLVSRNGLIGSALNTDRLAVIPDARDLYLESLRHSAETMDELSRVRPEDPVIRREYARELNTLTQALIARQDPASRETLDRLKAAVTALDPDDRDALRFRLDATAYDAAIASQRGDREAAIAAKADYDRMLDSSLRANPEDPRLLELAFQNAQKRMFEQITANDRDAALAADQDALGFADRWCRAAPRSVDAATQLGSHLCLSLRGALDDDRWEDVISLIPRCEKALENPLHREGRMLAYNRGLLALARGRVCIRERSWEEAGRTLDDGIASLRAASGRYADAPLLKSLLAHLLERRGHVAARRGDASLARDRWQEGRSIVTQCLSNAPADATMTSLKLRIEQQISELP